VYKYAKLNTSESTKERITCPAKRAEKGQGKAGLTWKKEKPKRLP
jgi:hypothetical protein